MRKWETRHNSPTTPEGRGLSFCLISTFTWWVFSCSKYEEEKCNPLQQAKGTTSLGTFKTIQEE